MSYHIKELCLDDRFERYAIKQTANELKTLPNLSKINIFVGANNSGKSRFLRQIAATGKLQFIPLVKESGCDFRDLSKAKEKFDSECTQQFVFNNVQETDNLRTQLSKVPPLKFFEEGAVFGEQMINALNTIFRLFTKEK